MKVQVLLLSLAMAITSAWGVRLSRSPQKFMELKSNKYYEDRIFSSCQKYIQNMIKRQLAHPPSDSWEAVYLMSIAFTGPSVNSGLSTIPQPEMNITLRLREKNSGVSCHTVFDVSDDEAWNTIEIMEKVSLQGLKLKKLEAQRLANARAEEDEELKRRKRNHHSDEDDSDENDCNDNNNNNNNNDRRKRSPNHHRRNRNRNCPTTSTTTMSSTSSSMSTPTTPSTTTPAA